MSKSMSMAVSEKEPTCSRLWHWVQGPSSSVVRSCTALAYHGEEGVKSVLSLINYEFRLAMALAGL